MRKPAAALAAALLVMPMAPQAARSDPTVPPPSLQGEQLYAVETITDVQGSIEISGTCAAVVGQSFTLTYRAEGTATGPYPGTFVESGVVTILPQTQVIPGSVTGVVIKWSASFTINSATGQVTGRKALTEQVSEGRCLEAQTGLDIKSAFALLQYDATIRPPTGGTFVDSGKADAVIEAFECFLPLCRPGYRVFQENFVVSNGPLPLDTSGKATGGGQIISAAGPLDRVTFGFNVKQASNGSGLNGNCNLLDHATRTKVKCLTATGYVQGGNTASWSGMALVNGEMESYRIVVQDNGEPNRGIDTFWITTTSYEAAGPVAHGNVQLHKQTL